jgi:hypothetical protein
LTAGVFSRVVARIAERVAGWDTEVVAYVSLTVAFAALLPYGLYIMAIALFGEGPLGVRELAGSGELWILSIGILASRITDLIRTPRGSGTNENGRIIMFVVLIAMLCVSVLPWAKVAAASVAQNQKFELSNKILALLGAPDIVLAIAFGYASLKVLRTR